MTTSLVAIVAITAFSFLPPSLPPPSISVFFPLPPPSLCFLPHSPFYPPSFSFLPLLPSISDECTQFLIDIGVELIILYEHIYEIYGDIQGARNSFDINAYEQGQQSSTWPHPQ